MSKGRKTLGRIDAELTSLRREESKLAADIEALADRMTKLRSEEIEAFRMLAAFRLAQPDLGRFEGRLDRAQAEIERFWSARAGTLADVTREIEARSAEIERLETERDRLSATISETRARIDTEDAAVLERLAGDVAYKERISAVEAAEKVAVEAERKAELAKEDRVEKGKPYEADPLFMYLWRRGYGTQDYRGRGLFRMLDAWVARMVRYQDARPNYYMLLEIPERLGEHAIRAREAVDEASESLTRFEAEKRGDAGILKLDEQADADEARHTATVDRLNDAIAARSALEAKRAAINRGEDDASRPAIDGIVNALQETSVKDLHRIARLTPDPADERLVEKIDDVRETIEDLDHELERRRRYERDLSAKIAELQEVRGRFVGEHYDDDRWEFDDDMVEDFLKQLLRGVINGAAVWAELRRRGRYTPGPTRPSGPWGAPTGGGSIGGGSIFSPRSGRSGGFGRLGGRGGGFRTGGGFRGTGFRTGGKF